MAVLTDAEIAEMLPATFTKPGLTEEEYFALCAKFDDFFVEYTADGTVIFMPGTDPMTSSSVADINFQLTDWARRDGRGWVTGPDASFFFPNGARREPDAAWVDEKKWDAAMAKEPRKRVRYSLPNSSSKCALPSSALAPSAKKWKNISPTACCSAG
jgi:hypothetical protein